jgi:hypothetical protein
MTETLFTGYRFAEAQTACRNKGGKQLVEGLRADFTHILCAASKPFRRPNENPPRRCNSARSQTCVAGMGEQRDTTPFLPSRRGRKAHG